MQNTFFSLHISMNLSNYVGLKQLKTFISSFNGNKKKISPKITVKNTLRNSYVEKYFLNGKQMHNTYVYIYE